ncbi:MAG: ABC transporter permease [Synergistaceae bacterium]|jgi:lipopolysaccharide transport system permease protein|nr:ABC transporter permease [Synergistaceae bacterium]
MPVDTEEKFDLIIEPNRAASDLMKDLFRYRELFYFLAWRDLLVRYKQTAVGVAWSVLRPLLTMIVFTLVFGRLAGMPDEGVPYPILVFSAMLPWQYFANAMQEGSNSLVAGANLISKIYFPRVIIPVSSVMVSAVDFLLSLALLGLLILVYGFAPPASFLFMPLFFVLATMAALGMGLWLSALNVKYRDFRHIVPFMVQFGIYISPVGFSSSVVPPRWRLLYSLNPMAGVIDGFRWCVHGTEPYLPGLVLSVATSAFLFWSGVKFFRRTENFFADFI